MQKPAKGLLCTILKSRLEVCAIIPLLTNSQQGGAQVPRVPLSRTLLQGWSPASRACPPQLKAFPMEGRLKGGSQNCDLYRQRWLSGSAFCRICWCYGLNMVCLSPTTHVEIWSLVWQCWEMGPSGRCLDQGSRSLMNGLVPSSCSRVSRALAKLA